MQRPWRAAIERTRVCALVVLAIGCGSQEPTTQAETLAMRDEPVARAPMLDASKVSGVYQVHGVTVQAANGLVREIDGILRLELKEETFSTTFELETSFPGPEGAFPASVVGWGQGLLVGDTMAGTVSSRMVRLDAPVDGKRLRLPAEELVIMSSSIARINAEGRLQVELQNQPGIEQEYSPSVTVLEGDRKGPLPEQS